MLLTLDGQDGSIVLYGLGICLLLHPAAGPDAQCFQSCACCSWACVAMTFDQLLCAFLDQFVVILSGAVVVRATGMKFCCKVKL